MAYWLDWLRCRVWGTGLGLIVVLLLVVAMVMIFFLQREVERKTQQGVAVIATITEIRFGVAKYRPGVMAGVVARDDKGTIGTESVEAPFISGCKVGDKIKAKRAGGELVLDPMPCR